jgi:hypothetical protein
MTTASLSSDPIADLWREARTWLADALRDFRGAAEIARTLAHDARAAIRRRLALIESLVMKLLLIEAAKHPFPDARAARGPGPMTNHAGKLSTPATAPHRPMVMDPGLGAVRQSGNGWKEDPARPETWRVRFHLRIPKRRRTPAKASMERLARLRAKPNAETGRARAKAIRLARRFEALRRMLASPRRTVARLARALHALGRNARACARRIALAQPPRAQSLGPTLANAIVYGCDASFSFPGDTS